MRGVLDIVRLDLFDSDFLAAFDRLYAEASRAGRKFATPWPLPERLASWQTPSTVRRYEGWLAVDEGEVVGVAEVELPLLDNTHLGLAAVYVPAGLQRRGIGSALADHVLMRLRDDGRRVVQAFIASDQVDPAGSDSGPPSSGEAFATAYGLTNRLVNAHQVLELPVPDDRLRRLAVGAASHHSDYRFDAWSDPCPDQHVAAYCRLKSAMLDQAPMGDLVYEPEVWDEERLREGEAELAAMGRTRYVQVAIASDETMVGHTELVVPRHDPHDVFQWDTLVLPEHRGHRLGLALKVANHVLVQSDHPDRRRAHTWNAAGNAPMVAVNDALGYRRVELVGEWQGPVPT